ncbi:MAG: hypothetical protein Q9226_005738 [Calogaya cf. arnoldii]
MLPEETEVQPQMALQSLLWPQSGPSLSILYPKAECSVRHDGGKIQNKRLHTG